MTAQADDPTARAVRAPGALDVIAAAPDHHEVLLENEHVRVLDASCRIFRQMLSNRDSPLVRR